MDHTYNLEVTPGPGERMRVKVCIVDNDRCIGLMRVLNDGTVQTKTPTGHWE